MDRRRFLAGLLGGFATVATSPRAFAAPVGEGLPEPVPGGLPAPPTSEDLDDLEIGYARRRRRRRRRRRSRRRFRRYLRRRRQFRRSRAPRATLRLRFD